jgi:exodeoxyribonuclease VIII
MTGRIITGLTFEDYRNVEGENFSTLKFMAKSPLHYLDAKENGVQEKSGFALGSAAHTAVLEPREWLRRYIIQPELTGRVNKDGEPIKLRQDIRMAEWRELVERATAEHKSIITESDNETATAVAQAVMLNPAASKLLRGKVSKEVTIQWTHSTGFLIRSRLDLVNQTVGTIVDLKTSAVITPKEWCAAAIRYQYLAQFAMYADAWHAATGEALTFKALVVEKSPPFDVAVFSISEDDLEFGRRTYEGWLETLAQCRASGEFPGVARGAELPFEIPPWAFPEEDDEILVA